MCSVSLLGVNPSSTLVVGAGLCPMMEAQILDLGYSLFLCTLMMVKFLLTSCSSHKVDSPAL